MSWFMTMTEHEKQCVNEMADKVMGLNYERIGELLREIDKCNRMIKLLRDENQRQHRLKYV